MIRFRWIPWALVLALFGILLTQRHSASKLHDRIARREVTIASLTKRGDSLAAVVASSKAHADTLYETRWLPAKFRIDTLADTVKVPVETVREVVKDADATIQACRVTVSECVEHAKTETARADSLQAQVNDWKRVAHGPVIAFNGFGATDLRGHLFAGAEVKANILSLHIFGRAETRLDSLGIGLRVGASIPF